LRILSAFSKLYKCARVEGRFVLFELVFRYVWQPYTPDSSITTSPSENHALNFAHERYCGFPHSLSCFNVVWFVADRFLCRPIGSRDGKRRSKVT
jgi:hypothetical protein